jgi:hypothetical protein
MADDDPSDFNSAFTAFGDPNPPGTTTAIGNTAQNPNDPLIDWASNLSKDDLAKFLHDPQGSAADMAARGVPPPPIDRIHDHNESMGTPSRSQRFDTQPASPLDQPLRVNPATGRLYNLTSDINTPPPQQQVSPGGMMGAPQMPASTMGLQPFPGGTSPGESAPPSQPPGQVYVPGKGMVERPPPRVPVQVPDNSTMPVGPNPPYTGGGALAGPSVQPGGGVGGTHPAIGQAAAATEPKEKEEGDPAVKAQEEEEEKRKKLGESISALGKALQGVKAPEPLKPPGFAPAPHGPSASGAPNIAALLGALSRTQTGQVPPSVMPLLKLMGR